MYAEIQVKVVELRTMYIEEEQKKWSKLVGNQVFIDRSGFFRDLNSATVAPSRELSKGANTSDI